MRGKFLLSLVLLGAAFAQATTNFPFPRNGTYAYGIKANNATSNAVQAAYEDWLSNQYDESGNYARVKFDDPSYTVSEGIGYGMLIMVYMDNATNLTQTKFDKLWAYYKANMNSNKLMNWKIQGYNNSCSGDNCNGATDGDLDAALALVMAYKQWGNPSYLSDAQAMASAIYGHEVDASKLLKPGDAWNDVKNPSYFSAAALAAFKNVSTSDWSSVLSANYAMVKANTNATSGLVTNWCTASGGDARDAAFGYDAVRTPWRMAIAYAWYGHSDAKTIAGNMANWIVNKTGGKPSGVVDGYSHDGTPSSSYNVATFVGAFGAAGMVDSKYQDWVNSSWTQLASGKAASDSYYHRSLKMLYELLLSGNFNNLWDGSSSGGGSTTPSTFKLTTASSNGTITLSPTGPSYDSGTSVTATATAAAGYTFSGWSGACTGTSSTCTVKMSKDTTLTASFTKINVPTYKLTTVATNGSIALSPTGPSYDSGTSVTATATAAAGYTFSNWSGACTGTNSTCTVKMSKDSTLTASFAKSVAPKYALTITAPTGGTIVATPSASSYDSGTVVSLVARPEYGYKFSGWSGDCSGSDSTCSLTMNAAHSVTASFGKAEMKKIDLSSSTGGSLTFIPAMASDSTFPFGSVVKVVAVPANGYVFSGWSNSCTGTDTCAITIGWYQALGATFTPLPMGISHRMLGGARLGLSEGVLAFDPSGMGSARLDMVDLKGRVVPLWQGEASSVGQVSLRNVATGLYFVRLRSASNSYQQMIQVLH